MRVKNRLLNFSDTIIYQDNECFLFSLDSVLLANFVTIKLTDKKIIDLCSGNAPIPMLLSFKTKARIFGVELQKEIYNMGYDSIIENNMENQISFINDDVNNVSNLFSAEEFDVVVCNPPYYKYANDVSLNVKKEKAIARHEIFIKLSDIIEKASFLLKNGGTFAMVHRPERMIEIINLMQKNNIEPKKMRLVYPKSGKEANMLLIEGVKCGKSNMKVMQPLIVHDDNGNYVEEVKMMFQENYNNEVK